MGLKGIESTISEVTCGRIPVPKALTQCLCLPLGLSLRALSVIPDAVSESTIEQRILKKQFVAMAPAVVRSRRTRRVWFRTLNVLQALIETGAKSIARTIAIMVLGSARAGPPARPGRLDTARPD